MTYSRYNARHSGTISRLLSTLPAWQRAEIRLTFAMTDADVVGIADAAGIDAETVYLITRRNPYDDPRLHQEMPRGPNGCLFAKEMMQQDRQFSGSSAAVQRMWEKTIDEIQAAPCCGNLIDPSSLTPEIGSRRCTLSFSKKDAVAIDETTRVAVRLAFVTNSGLDEADIASALHVDEKAVRHLTRCRIGSSEPINRGAHGIEQTKDMFFAERTHARSNGARDENAWIACLISVRQLRNALLKGLDWRLLDAVAKVGNYTNPLLIDLKGMKP